MIRSQRGATLVIALIMLVLLTLFAISALNCCSSVDRLGDEAATTGCAESAAIATKNAMNRITPPLPACRGVHA